MGNDSMINGSSNQKLPSINGLYEKFLNPILSKDEGFDAEQLTQLTLGTLGQVSVLRQWPIITHVLQQVKTDLQR